METQNSKLKTQNSPSSPHCFRIVFMGTPHFAVPSLEAVFRSDKVIAVVTQPDRPQGRGRELSFSPVKEIARKRGFPVFQPERLRRDTDFMAALSDLAPDLIVVVAFGQILPEAVLKIPKKGCINLHASLLPQYRGAAPIQWALIHGEQETGVTTMQMDVGMDTGPILLQQSVPIEPMETADQLTLRLSLIGADLLVETLAQLKTGHLRPIPQGSTSIRMAPLLKKEDGFIRWEESSEAIFNRWRGVFPWPGTTTFYDKTCWKVIALEVGERERPGKPGELLQVSERGVEVAAGMGSVWITRLQLSGKQPISPKEYQAGHALIRGSLFSRG